MCGEGFISFELALETLVCNVIFKQSDLDDVTLTTYNNVTVYYL